MKKKAVIKTFNQEIGINIKLAERPMKDDDDDGGFWVFRFVLPSIFSHASKGR